MKNSTMFFDICILLLPLILGYSIAALCPIKKDTGKNVSFRPNPIVFSIVWPVLFLMLGWAWMIASKNNPQNHIIYALIIISLCSWTYMYGCQNNKIASLYTLITSLLFIIIAMITSPQQSQILLAFLLVWCLFATFMNVDMVN